MKKRLPATTRLAIPVLGALLGLGAVSCSGDASGQLDGWAKNLCGAAQGPIAQSQGALADTGKVDPAETSGDLAKRLSADLATLATANQQLADAVGKVGAPQVDSGSSLQAGAVGELRQAAQGYLQAQQKLNAIPTTDQARFADGLRSIGDQVQSLSQQSTAALTKLQTGALGTALARQSGCKAGVPAPAAGSADPAGPSASTRASPFGSGSAAPNLSPSEAAPSASGSGSSKGSPSASASPTG